MGDDNDHNRPKRCQMRRLGCKVIFFILRVFFILTNVFSYTLVVFTLRGAVEGWWGRR